MLKFNEWYKEDLIDEKGLIIGLYQELPQNSVSTLVSTKLFDAKLLGNVQVEYLDRKPAFNFGDSTAELALKNGFPREMMINPPDILDGTRKLEMHKKLLGKSYVPKTVFSIEDAKEQLKFPIIAKATYSHSAKGVFKIDTKDDIEKTYKEIKKLQDKSDDPDEDLNPDVFCETIDIKKEWRTILYKYNNGDMYIIYLVERIPNGDKIKNLREEVLGYPYDDLDFLNKKEDANFKWELQNLKTTKILTKEAIRIIKDCFSLNPEVKMMAVDFCMDNNNKMWYIECNAHPGISFYMGMSYFYHAVRDFYGEGFDEESMSYKKLIQLAKKSNILTNKIYSEYKVPEFEPDIIGKKIN